MVNLVITGVYTIIKLFCWMCTFSAPVCSLLCILCTLLCTSVLIGMHNVHNWCTLWALYVHTMCTLRLSAHFVNNSAHGKMILCTPKITFFDCAHCALCFLLWSSVPLGTMSTSCTIVHQCAQPKLLMLEVEITSWKKNCPACAVSPLDFQAHWMGRPDCHQ